MPRQFPVRRGDNCSFEVVQYVILWFVLVFVVWLFTFCVAVIVVVVSGGSGSSSSGGSGSGSRSSSSSNSSSSGGGGGGGGGRLIVVVGSYSIYICNHISIIFIYLMAFMSLYLSVSLSACSHCTSSIVFL